MTVSNVNYKLDLKAISAQEVLLFSAFEKFLSESQIKALLDFASTQDFRKVKYLSKVSGKAFKIITNFHLYQALLGNVSGCSNVVDSRTLIVAGTVQKGIKVFLRTYKSLASRYRVYLQVSHRSEKRQKIFAPDLHTLFLGSLIDRRRLIKETMNKLNLLCAPFIIYDAFFASKNNSFLLRLPTQIACETVSFVKGLRSFTMVLTAINKACRSYQERLNNSKITDEKTRDKAEDKFQKKLKKQQFFWQKGSLHFLKIIVQLAGTKLFNPIISMGTSYASLKKRAEKVKEDKSLKEKKVKVVHLQMNAQLIKSVVLTLFSMFFVAYLVFMTHEGFNKCKSDPQSL